MSPADPATRTELRARTDRQLSPTDGGRAWPAGNTSAVALTFDVDARSVMLAADPASDSSYFDADAPYLAPECGRELVEVPVSWALDDWERYAFWPGITGDGRIDRPSAAVAAWWEEIQAIHEIGGLAVLTMHPFLSGRPARVGALRDLIERCLATSGLWVTALDDAVRWYRDQNDEKG